MNGIKNDESCGCGAGLPGWAVVAAGMALGLGAAWLLDRALRQEEQTVLEEHEWPEPKQWGK